LLGHNVLPACLDVLHKHVHHEVLSVLLLVESLKQKTRFADMQLCQILRGPRNLEPEISVEALRKLEVSCRYTKALISTVSIQVHSIQGGQRIDAEQPVRPRGPLDRSLVSPTITRIFGPALAQHPGEALDPPALVNGCRTVHRALSRHPRFLDTAELPEALRLDHSQESVRAAATGQRWPDYFKTSGRLLNLGIVLGKKVPRYRDGRAIVSPLLELERPPKVIDRTVIIPN
jgi:hypothetical protein